LGFKVQDIEFEVRGLGFKVGRSPQARVDVAVVVGVVAARRGR
jgi:hypothetical protein